MVYLKNAQPSRGQGYRDMVRCEALEKLYRVNTIDDKHEALLGREGDSFESLPTSHLFLLKENIAEQILLI